MALSHTAWGYDTVEVSHAQDGVATIVELRGNRIGTLFAFGVIDTAERLEQGDLLCRQSRNRHNHPCGRPQEVLPPPGQQPQEGGRGPMAAGLLQRGRLPAAGGTRHRRRLGRAGLPRP